VTTAAPKLAGFAVALVVLFAIGALAGGLIDPAPPKAAKAKADGAGHQEATSMGAMTEQAGGEHGAMDVRGLGVADDELRLVVDDTGFTRGATEQLRFHIVDADGEALRDFDVEHTKRMHLIVVRRDLTGFQHLHPRADSAGNWSIPLTLADAGSYRMFADFSHDGEPATLATDLTVDGAFEKRPLTPAPASGFDVQLEVSDVHAGEEAAMTFNITRNGEPVEVEPYLGANGHLVALREGDLAFLHVHPSGGTTFEATFPTKGRYGLFLQFKVDGEVHTAKFVQRVD
jgi:hypothetical protein